MNSSNCCSRTCWPNASRAPACRDHAPCALISQQEVRWTRRWCWRRACRLAVALSTARPQPDDQQIADTPALTANCGWAGGPPDWGDLKAQWLVRDAVATVQDLVCSSRAGCRARPCCSSTPRARNGQDDSGAMAVAGVRDRLAHQA